jgi:hypothetical protein
MPEEDVFDEEPWNSVRKNFREYWSKVKARVGPDGWAPLYEGQVDLFVKCFCPAVEYFAKQPREDDHTLCDLEQVVFNEIANGVYGPLQTPTYPWSPSELLRDSDFRTSLNKIIATTMRRFGFKFGRPLAHIGCARGTPVSECSSRVFASFVAQG